MLVQVVWFSDRCFWKTTGAHLPHRPGNRKAAGETLAKSQGKAGRTTLLESWYALHSRVWNGVLLVYHMVLWSLLVERTTPSLVVSPFQSHEDMKHRPGEFRLPGRP